MNLINSDHPLLLAESDPWREDKWDSGVLEGMADEAFQLMKENNGVGLAMNQVGVDCSCFIMCGDFFLPRYGVKKVDDEYQLNMGHMMLLGNNLRKVDGEYYMLFVNPWFKDQHRGITRKAEGCLSLGKKYKVARAKSIRAGWLGIHSHAPRSWGGAIPSISVPHDMPMSGDLARVFQHECDHTKGLLISNKGKVIK
jgi:peptide deformylase